MSVGGKDGYIGRDGRVPPGEEQRVGPIGAGGGRQDRDGGADGSDERG